MATEFPSNRHKDKSEVVEPEKKKVDRVTQNEIVQRKKPVGKRLTETFIGGDARSVWAFVALDVLVPAAKDMLADAVSQGVERMIFGEAQSVGRRSGRRPSGGSHVPYQKYSSSGARRLGPPDERSRHEIGMSRRARASHNFDEIILATRIEADQVLERLLDLVDKYETATVADLYDLVGISGDYTDDKWGWFDLRGADIRRVREGYLLDLPRPEPLSD
jgi:hypothetical protein